MNVFTEYSVLFFCSIAVTPHKIDAMRSRKKAEGKARRTKKALAKCHDSIQSSCEQIANSLTEITKQSSCAHGIFQENSCSNEDWTVCHELSSSLMAKGFDFYDNTKNCKLIHDVFDIFQKYETVILGDSVRETLFRELILLKGTQNATVINCQLVVKQSSVISIQHPILDGYLDITLEMLNRVFILPSVLMLASLEMQDKFDGTFGAYVQAMAPLVTDFMACPRSCIRFLHKRNSCDCLEELYRDLKRSMKRRTLCCGCMKSKDVKEVRSCACGIYQYCSRQCQLDNYSQHKELCKAYCQQRDSKANLLIEEVD